MQRVVMRIILPSVRKKQVIHRLEVCGAPGKSIHPNP
jgi:hypothetical protein